MTLAPSSDFGIRGIEGPRYEVNEICAAPGCTERARHGHHLWPRSFLRNQPQDWVVTPGGIVVGDKVGLCVDHHGDVTGDIGGHRAWISFTAGCFWWNVRFVGDVPSGAAAPVWVTVGPLQHQPPGALPAAAQDAPSGPSEDTEEVCEKCGKPKHTKPKVPPGERRKAKTWTMVVPDDKEIGADVIDEWVDDFAVILGFSDETSRLRRYHAFVTVMAWAIQHREQFVADLREASR